VGYLVPAPLPGSEQALPWRLLLYVLAHGYEGRLGKEAISRRGLVYWIDSSYRSDGRNGWIELLAGVDPDKRNATRDLLVEQTRGLVDRPPSDDEIAEAKRHLAGRRRTAAQSNAELAARHADDWLTTGGLLTTAALEQALGGVDDDAIRAVARDFAQGLLVIVE
jgi:predicted Zn-dependent peptidase